MVLNWSLVAAINLLLCVVILILGYIGFKKSRNILIPYVSLAFGLFGISHLLLLFSNFSEDTLIFVRVLAYILVIFGLCQAARCNKN